MQPSIHPTYQSVDVQCSCGTRFSTRSTHAGDLRVEVCSACHPHISGHARPEAVGGRIQRFRRRAARRIVAP